MKLKKNLQGNNNRVDEAENQINDLEHKEAKNSQSEQEKEIWIQNNDDSVSSLWDNFKQSNIHFIWVPEGGEKEQEIGNLFEKCFLYLVSSSINVSIFHMIGWVLSE